MTAKRKKSAKPEGMTGEQLDKGITKLGFNQQSFARKINVNDRTVRGWIAGRSEVPRVVAMLVNLMIHTEATAEDLKA